MVDTCNLGEIWILVCFTIGDLKRCSSFDLFSLLDLVDSSWNICHQWLRVFGLKMVICNWRQPLSSGNYFQLVRNCLLQCIS